MLKVGLTGGMASGKSFVGKAFAERGCLLIEADLLGHEVLSPQGAAYPAVVHEFGRAILSPDGTIDRRRLAAEVFGKPDRLALLNKLVHPAVYQREEELMATASADSIVVVAAAILVETGSYRRFDRLVVAACTREQQIERAMKRDGATREQVLQRLERQLPLEEKRKLADYVIDTSGTKEETLRQTEEVHNCLRRLCEVTTGV